MEQVVNLMLFYQSLSVRQLETLKHLIYKTQALAANATFEHTSKIVLNAGDMLGFITGGAADVDVVVNYLEQTL
jgi:hypothetical protein